MRCASKAINLAQAGPSIHASKPSSLCDLGKLSSAQGCWVLGARKPPNKPWTIGRDPRRSKEQLDKNPSKPIQLVWTFTQFNRLDWMVSEQNATDEKKRPLVDSYGMFTQEAGITQRQKDNKNDKKIRNHYKPIIYSYSINILRLKLIFPQAPDPRNQGTAMRVHDLLGVRQIQPAPQRHLPVEVFSNLCYLFQDLQRVISFSCWFVILLFVSFLFVLLLAVVVTRNVWVWCFRAHQAWTPSRMPKQYAWSPRKFFDIFANQESQRGALFGGLIVKIQQLEQYIHPFCN